MGTTTRLQRCTLPILLLALSGCTLYSPPGERAPVETRPQPGVVVEDAPPPVAPQPPPAVEPNAVHAYGGLLGKARTASAGGDYDGAIALLERAQRIDPDSAEIYLELARTYTAQGRTDQARATASRGTLYCRTESECRALRALAH